MHRMLPAEEFNGCASAVGPIVEPGIEECVAAGDLSIAQLRAIAQSSLFGRSQDMNRMGCLIVAGGGRIWPIADIAGCTAHIRLRGVKRTSLSDLAHSTISSARAISGSGTERPSGILIAKLAIV